MRFIELVTADRRDDPAATRIEWLHRDHIETVEAWPDSRDQRRAWLELTLTSGRTRFVPISAGVDLEIAAAAAISLLLEDDSGTVAVEQ